ncbi:GNAT family N-acetyltransferase [Pseudomonas sp. DC1.2]|nr:GNAT family N-acetyltransferase [Pseudomonas sp. DC1.2]MEB0047431.1 GNAT family N-acetyltransferase [Pseudomonas sp. Dout3]MEB0098451.1 GNAT family N-acetyltransferase [Pseudomonas sp. DC1.2]WPX60718.1 GNAT family N-acetyltransferase [Pseudomonas sp. DC1.2]
MSRCDEIVLRPATSEHFDAVIELRALLLEGSEANYACVSVEERKLWRDAYSAWLRDVLSRSQTTQLLVAVCDGRVVGCVTGFVDRRAPGPDCLNGLCGWVQSLVVSPAFRSRGLSRVLMQSLMEWFEGRQVGKVVLQSTPAAEPLYERIGYSRSSEYIWTWPAREQRA